jgi:hypothetical protein
VRVFSRTCDVVSNGRRLFVVFQRGASGHFTAGAGNAGRASR